MKITVNKEQMVTIGKAGIKIGKSVIIEGTKAVLAKGAVTMISEGLDNGIDGIKKLSLDDVLGKKEKEEKEKRKRLFGRKKKVKVDAEQLTETLTEVVETAYDAGVEEGKKDDSKEA